MPPQMDSGGYGLELEDTSHLSQVAYATKVELLVERRRGQNSVEDEVYIPRRYKAPCVSLTCDSCLERDPKRR